jgi:hypothetical protein
METEREGEKKRHTPTVLKRGKENKNKKRAEGESER